MEKTLEIGLGIAFFVFSIRYQIKLSDTCNHNNIVILCTIIISILAFLVFLVMVLLYILGETIFNFNF